MKRLTLVLVLLAAVAAQFQDVQAQDAGRLLRAAMNTETVDGDLRKAITQYRELSTNNDRLVAATALLRMAGCYERLGLPGARAVYQSIVSGYADQPAVVSVARSRLAATAPVRQVEPAARRVLDGTYASMFHVSADGRFAVGPERAGYSSYNVVLRDLATGGSRVLVGGSVGRYGFQARLSRDGKQVAYNWFEGTTPALGLIGTEPGATPVMVPTTERALLTAADWAPDGKAVLVLVQRFDNPTDPQTATSTDLAWLSVDDKSLRVIKVFQPWQQPFFEARVSPDGRWIAYVARPQQTSTDRYLYVIDAAGQREKVLVGEAGTRELPNWTPSGAHLVFANTGSGRTSLVSIGVQDGTATGSPTVLQPEFSGSPIGFTTSGVFYFTRSDGTGGNYEFIVDRAAPQAGRPQAFTGLSGTWSPDGRSVAFVRSGAEGIDLVVRDVASGQERSYRRAGLTNVSPRWLPDNASVVVIANDAASGTPGPAFQLADLKTGSFRRLFARDANGRGRTGVGTLSLDGKTLYVGTRTNAASPITGVVAIDVATGEERTVTTFTPGTGQSAGFGIAISPDGTTLAVTTAVQANATGRIFTVGVDGSNYREVLGPFETGWIGDTTRWTPDGQSLVFVAFDANRQWQIMRVPASGGPAVPEGISYGSIGTLLPNLRLFPGNFNNIDVSPDGTRLLVSCLTLAKQELWTVDGLLAAINAK